MIFFDKNFTGVSIFSNLQHPPVMNTEWSLSPRDLVLIEIILHIKCDLVLRAVPFKIVGVNHVTFEIMGGGSQKKLTIWGVKKINYGGNCQVKGTIVPPT